MGPARRRGFARGRRRRPRVRRRRWGRRRWRRRRRLRRRRRRRGYFRRTLILRQWHPTTTRKLRITGWFPSVLCSNKRSANNFIVHEPDIPARGAGYGGNISVSNWSLSILYHEWLKNRNRWSRNNQDLDLVRYTSCSLRFYRDDTRDFIASYSLESPMVSNQWTHLKSHPQLMLLRKKHILIPSMATRPRGKRWVTVKVKPPRLMRNQYYFQRHFCDVKLVQVTVSGLDLKRPWLRKGTESPVVEFKVLKPELYKNISILPSETETIKDQHETLYKDVYPFTMNWKTILKELYDQTDTSLPPGIPLNQVVEIFKSKYLYENFKKKYTDRKTKLNTLNENAEHKFGTTLSKEPLFDRVFGIFSAFLLDSDARYDNIFKTAYSTVRYSPLVDQGLGNKVWMDPLTKKDNVFTPPQSKLLYQDLPLWLIFYGYADWARKYYAGASPGVTYRVLLMCPYTYPPLTNKELRGYVFYSDDFGKGRLPYNQFKISPQWETLWYPMLFNQEPVMEAIVNCGPWMPRDDESKSWQLTMGYKFNFILGGSLPPGQAPVDPCTRPTHELPESHMLERAVQVSDPSRVEVPFHHWDIRRGLFSDKSVKRVQEYSTDDDAFAEPPPKRHTLDPPVEGAGQTGEGALSSGSVQVLRHLLQTPSSPRSRASEEEPEDQAQAVKQLLQRELQRQREHQQRIKQSIQEVFSSLQLTQMGYHLDQRLL